MQCRRRYSGREDGEQHGVRLQHDDRTKPRTTLAQGPRRLKKAFYREVSICMAGCVRRQVLKSAGQEGSAAFGRRVVVGRRVPKMERSRALPGGHGADTVNVNVSGKAATNRALQRGSSMGDGIQRG